MGAGLAAVVATGHGIVTSYCRDRRGGSTFDLVLVYGVRDRGIFYQIAAIGFV